MRTPRVVVTPTRRPRCSPSIGCAEHDCRGHIYRHERNGPRVSPRYATTTGKDEPVGFLRPSDLAAARRHWCLDCLFQAKNWRKEEPVAKRKDPHPRDKDATKTLDTVTRRRPTLTSRRLGGHADEAVSLPRAMGVGSFLPLREPGLLPCCFQCRAAGGRGSATPDWLDRGHGHWLVESVRHPGAPAAGHESVVAHEILPLAEKSGDRWSRRGANSADSRPVCGGWGRVGGGTRGRPAVRCSTTRRHWRSRLDNAVIVALWRSAGRAV